MKGLFEEGTLHCNFIKSIFLSNQCLHSEITAYVTVKILNSATEMCAEFMMTLHYIAW